MIDKKTLEVGDIVFEKQGTSLRRLKIERVTRTQAIIGSIKLKREVTNSWLNEIGGSIWSRTSFYLSTPELESEYQRQKLLNRVSRFDYSHLSNEELTTVLLVIKRWEDNNINRGEK